LFDIQTGEIFFVLKGGKKTFDINIEFMNRGDAVLGIKDIEIFQ